jgi:hypothetical protein
MPMAPTKAPAAPGSIAPQGPSGIAPKVYPNLSGKVAVQAGGDTSDPWRGGAVATPNGKVQTKGAVAVKQAKEAPGNQGAKNAHTKPGKIKPVGSDTGMRKTESVSSTTALKKGPAARVYPNLSSSNGVGA